MSSCATSRRKRHPNKNYADKKNNSTRFREISWADFYIQSDPSAFDPKARFGGDANDDPATLPSRTSLRTYPDDIAARTDVFLRGLDDVALLEEKTLFPWTGATVMERVLYTFRHTTYHIGELSYILRVNGAKATEWK